MDYRPLITPITNGLGAGTTLAMAAEHSMLELLQRDGNGLSIRALDAGVRVALPDNVPPAAARLLRALRAADVNVMVKLTSTDFGLTGLCVVGRAAHDDILTGTACGEAVHADPGTALVKALAEFAGARARKRAMHGPLAALDRVAPPGYVGRCLGAVDLASDEGRLLTAMGSWLDDDPSSVWDQLERTVFAVKSTVPLPAATRLPNRSANHILTDAGFEPLLCIISENHLHATKGIVPGLEVETMAYHRMTPRNFRRLQTRWPSWTSEQSTRPGQYWANVRAVDEEVHPRWVNTAALHEAVGQLLPLYREPEDHALQVALGRHEPWTRA